MICSRALTKVVTAIEGPVRVIADETISYVTGLVESLFTRSPPAATRGARSRRNPATARAGVKPFPHGELQQAVRMVALREIVNRGTGNPACVAVRTPTAAVQRPFTGPASHGTESTQCAQQADLRFVTPLSKLRDRTVEMCRLCAQKFGHGVVEARRAELRPQRDQGRSEVDEELRQAAGPTRWRPFVAPFARIPRRHDVGGHGSHRTNPAWFSNHGTPSGNVRSVCAAGVLTAGIHLRLRTARYGLRATWSWRRGSRR